MNRRELTSAFFLLAVAVFVAVEASSLGIGTPSAPGPGFMLFFASVALGAFSLILLVASARKRTAKGRILDIFSGVEWRSVMIAIFALVLFPVFLSGAGYLATAFGFLLVLFGIGRMKAWITVTSALITTAVSYLIFKVLLGVPFS